MLLWYVTAALLVLAGIALIIWRKDLTYIQAAMAGARMPQGCAIAEGIALIVLAILFFLAARAGAFG